MFGMEESSFEGLAKEEGKGSELRSASIKYSAIKFSTLLTKNFRFIVSAVEGVTADRVDVRCITISMLAPFPRIKL